MDADKDYETIGRFIYGAHRIDFALALMMQKMGKPIVAAPPGERIDLATNALEADAMFARLPASDDAKAQFSSLMQSLVTFGRQLDALDSLGAADFAACAAGTSAALGALPRFGAMVDELRA